MKRFLLFSLTSVSAYVLFVGGCSSSGGNSGQVPCDDAGACSGGLVCQNGVCVQPSGQGGSGQGGSGNTGNGGSGNIGNGGSGNTGTGGVPSGGSGGVPSGGGGGPSGGGTGGGTGGGGNCGDFPFNTPSCQTCMETYCCSEMSSCGSGSPCYLFAQCFATNCASDPTPACAETYCGEFSDGLATYETLDGCFASNCTSSCSG